MNAEQSQPNAASQVLIEAGIRVSAWVTYFCRSHLQGCQLEPISQDIQSEGGNQFDYSMTGRVYVPAQTILAYWAESGEFAGKWRAAYWLVQASPSEAWQTLKFDRYNYLQGQVRILAQSTNSRAERLRDWWQTWAPVYGGQTATMAQWLNHQIKRGFKTPGPHPALIGVNDTQGALTFKPIAGWRFETVTAEQLERFGEWFK